MNNMPDRPNVSASLVAIHMTITRGIDVTIEKSRTFASDGFPSEALRKGFVDYVQSLIQVVDAHHQGEDAVAFPQLRPKLAGAPYDELQAEHRSILPLLDQMRSAAGEIAAGEGPRAALDRLGEAAARLKDLWHPHIAKEETSFSMSALARSLTPVEQDQLNAALGADSQKRLTSPFLALPFVLYNMPPEVRTYFASTMPPAITKELVPVTWKDQWAPMRPFLLA